MKANKSLMLGALVITLSIIVIGVSGSYAYFVNSVQEKNSEFKGVSVTSGELSMNFLTDNDKYINTESATLIDDSEVTSKADYTTFSIELPGDSKVNSALYEIYISDITMTNNFKTEDLKWALYKRIDGTFSEYARGDFSGVELKQGENVCPVYDKTARPLPSAVECTSSKLSLKQNILINKGTVDSYYLYIWVSNANYNQAYLLEGTLSGKVSFKAITQ